MRAWPSAKKAAERSSITERTERSSVWSAAHANGVEREPGLTQTSRTPASRSVAKSSRAHSPMRCAAPSAGRLADIEMADSERERGGRDHAQARLGHHGF